MKNLMLSLAFASAITTLSAQNKIEKKPVSEFNKWSIELAGGVNKPQRPMSSSYFTSTPSPYVADLGVRYMFNNKFGLKADFGYNSFTGKNNSIDFDTKYYRADIQAVANLGRIMNFETWTNTIGILGHAGFGLAQLEDQNSAIKDRMGNFIAGITGQIKLTNRLVLTGDFTTIVNARQDYTFDAATANNGRGFSGVLFNGTVGLTVYLGKNEKHADWVIDNGSEIDDLRKRITDIETSMLDTDKDGVPDYLDEEPNTISGVMVNTKGKSIDLNNNNVPDELESYLLKTYGSNTDKSPILGNNELIKNLINGGYVCTYFDFGKSTPTNVSTEGIDFILNYLRNNPNASVDIIGHADEIGKSAYNDKLAASRANNVKDVLVKAKINPSRLNIVSAGEDTSVEKDSDAARKLVRKVTFRVK
ncbi:OmpA family protein [Flavobacterium hibernum]|uniref:Flagellar motor protein MotB n=1 Tax=Flavobacterium hibernum TaxID=37752 RepID=A0A0D0EJ52_9FLAO|nr:OmpA family protein [Flavobacterium hibernum]KIO50755.1 flagellar motor protein MotB [Flavobacterium hibernum]OXA83494.1 flagellar motor protein MotB [Flavobacterium hibernum]STO18701.1 Root adhesin [Flavobacterium hibernum]